MKTKIVGISAIAVSILLTAQPAMAGFGLPGVTKNGDKTEAGTVSKDSVLAEIGTITADYSKASLEILTARQLSLEALGLSTEAAKCKEAADKIANGLTLQETQKLTKSDPTVDKAVADQMAKQEELSPEQRQKFAQSLLHLAVGVVMEKKMIDAVSATASNAQKVLGSAGVAEKVQLGGKLKPIISFAAVFPGDVKNTLSTLGTYTKFAQSKGIEVPANATSALGD
ncbi:MAG TPA: hypothetical protein PK322_02515 [Opitutaceae bacterium]|nr:hypothetical protein [Opitutaceae bacterium]